jgi:hypothetical protein
LVETAIGVPKIENPTATQLLTVAQEMPFSPLTLAGTL